MRNQITPINVKSIEIIHKIWLGKEIPANYWQNTIMLADQLTNNEKIIFWADDWYTAGMQNNKYNHDKIEFRNIGTLLNNTALTDLPDKYECELEKKHFNKYQYFWFHVFREMIGENSNYSQASDFLRYEILRQYPGVYIDNDIKIDVVNIGSITTPTDDRNFLCRIGLYLNLYSFFRPRITANSDIIECSIDKYPKRMIDKVLSRVTNLNNQQKNGKSLMAIKRTRTEATEFNANDIFKNYTGSLTMELGPRVISQVFMDALNKTKPLDIGTSCQTTDENYAQYINGVFNQASMNLLNKIAASPQHTEENKEAIVASINAIKDIFTLEDTWESKAESLTNQFTLLINKLACQESTLSEYGKEIYPEYEEYREALFAHSLLQSMLDSEEIVRIRAQIIEQYPQCRGQLFEKIFNKTLICGKFLVRDAVKQGDRWDTPKENNEEELFINILKKIKEKDIDLLIGIMYTYSQIHNENNTNQKEQLTTILITLAKQQKITTNELMFIKKQYKTKLIPNSVVQSNNRAQSGNCAIS